MRAAQCGQTTWLTASRVLPRCCTLRPYSSSAAEGSGAAGSPGQDGESGRPKGKQGANTTADKRRRILQSWENAFFGRAHYEPGMREGYRAAVDSEEGGEVASAGMSNRELFPNWAEDEDAPYHEFLQLSDALKRRYIINRLAMGERRVTFAPYYGSMFMMQHLNLGEMMINEAERLLTDCGWMSDTVASKIAAVRESAARVKFEYDLD
ncbi:hypothetical protein TRVL_00963 [Trypanosoma vivax]|nr:hypothetical protein TRVL_00963 [Trypanosoma vivax]